LQSCLPTRPSKKHEIMMEIVPGKKIEKAQRSAVNP
jgi:hypothetical protein